MSSDYTCPHCNTRPGENEIADGWCDNCGKRLPSWVRVEGDSTAPLPTVNEPPGWRPLLFLWAVGACTVGGLLAAAAALTGGG
jgi:hypothetical protein